MQRDLKKNEDNVSEYDTDLDRTMYKEFWTDLSEFKKPEPSEEELRAQARSMDKRSRQGGRSFSTLKPRAGSLEGSRSTQLRTESTMNQMDDYGMNARKLIPVPNL